MLLIVWAIYIQPCTNLFKNIFIWTHSKVQKFTQFKIKLHAGEDSLQLYITIRDKGSKTLVGKIISYFFNLPNRILYGIMKCVCDLLWHKEVIPPPSLCEENHQKIVQFAIRSSLMLFFLKNSITYFGLLGALKLVIYFSIAMFT